MLNIDWSNMFSFSMSPIELFIRGTLIYLLLFFVFRFVARRDTGSLTVSDLLVLVIIADASQNAMAGGYKSIVDGGVLIGTIICWSLLLNFLSFRFKSIRRFIVPAPVCLIKDGVKQKKNLRKEMITDDELNELLRKHDLNDFSEVTRAYLEPDGEITVLR
tara:strand:+ start:19285 stop:19767 length:483 start_codon:yes stop_codon:yes gene_type:complete